MIPYTIENQAVAFVPVKHPLPLGSWRSVDYSQQTFFTESFADELAVAGLARLLPVATISAG